MPQIARIPPPTKHVKQFDLSPQSTTRIATFLYVPIPATDNNQIPAQRLPLSPSCTLVVVICRQPSPSCLLTVRNLWATVPELFPNCPQAVCKCPRIVPIRPKCSLLSPAYNFFCFALTMLLYIYTSNADVNTKSLPPRLGETRRRTAQHENRTDAVPPFRN